MELLSFFNEIKIANCIKEAIQHYSIFTKTDKNLTKVKSELKEKCNIIFFNIISSSSSNLKIMVKTHKHSYFYIYEFGSKEIILIGGVRKNVDTM